MSKEINGWWLPTKDSYFQKFVEDNPTRKRNGFCRQNLEHAFRYVKNWRTAIDIGAHIGFWARDMREHFAHVHCFEPAEDVWACLVKNMAEYDNVTLHHLAVGETPGHCTVCDDPTRPGNTGSRFVNPAGTESAIVSIDTMAFTEVDFMKIDVEGFEPMVLRGARKTIARCKPVIIMETDKQFSNRYAWDHHAGTRMLFGMGYKEVAHMRPDKIFVPV